MISLNFWLWILLLVIGVFMIITKSLTKPFIIVWYGCLYTVIGSVFLFALNLAGEYIGYHMPINPITALITGFMGIPGVTYLVLVKSIFIGI